MQKNRLIGAMLAAAFLLAGCDNSEDLKQQINQQNQQIAQLGKLSDQQYNIIQGLLKKHDEKNRAASIFQGCAALDGIGARFCPQQALDAGRDALADGYPGVTDIYWSILVGKLVALAAIFAAFLGVAWLMFIRLVGPAQVELDEARKTIQTANEQAQAKRAELKQAEVAAAQAQNKLNALKSEIKKRENDLQELLDQIAQAEKAKKDLDDDNDLLDGFE